MLNFVEFRRSTQAFNLFGTMTITLFDCVAVGITLQLRSKFVVVIIINLPD